MREGGDGRDSSQLQEPHWDPVFLDARREAWMIFALWGVCFAWSIPVCYWLGYTPPREPDALPLICGFPRWAFWGILVPWVCADVATIVFCWKIMRDAPLEPTATESRAGHGGG